MDSTRVAEELDSRGYARLGSLLSTEESAGLAAMYSNDEAFRSHIIMRRHGFGEGEYKYFRNPLPEIVASLRKELYSFLAPVANEWHE